MAMPKGFSRYSIRRRVKESVANLIEGLSSDQSYSEADFIAPVSNFTDDSHDLGVLCEVIDGSECQGEEVETNQVIENLNSGDDNDSCDRNSSDGDEFESEYLNIDDEEGFGSHNVQLSTHIAEWAIHFGVSHSALRYLLRILNPFHPELPLDPRTLLKTPTNYAVKEMSNKQGHYYHFGIASGIDFNIGLPDGPIMLQFNVDGLPLFKSSSIELWPILCLVKGAASKPFVVGLYCGKKKPCDLNEFLCDFVDDLKHLLHRGIDQNGVHRDLVLDCFICDAPARAFIKNIKLYSGYSGCGKCIQEGEYTEGKVTYPITTARLRTDEEFLNMVDEEHHRGPSPLAQLSIGMVTGFVFDSMH
jgi:hypothetical protein